MMEFKNIVRRFLGGGTAFCIIASSILNPANFKVRAAETTEDITAGANITTIGAGTVKLEKVTGADRKVNYRLTATPSNGYRLKKIKLNETTITETKAAGGAYILRGYGQTKIAQKVYFGKNPIINADGDKISSELVAAQGWWIAGYQASGYGENRDEGALVLLCDPYQAMDGEDEYNAVKFLVDDKYEQNDKDSKYYNETPYNRDPADIINIKDWGCKYRAEFTPTGKVYANYYGGSDIRKTLQGYLTETAAGKKRFSAAEQGLMKETTVRTHDSKNDEYYSTTDKLYLGSSDIMPSSSFYTPGFPNRGDLLPVLYITVGANDGLKVALASKEALDMFGEEGEEYSALPYNGPEGSPYSAPPGGEFGDECREFLLRSPSASSSYTVLNAVTGNYVSLYDVGSSARCVPACALDLSSVIFASAAKPQSSSTLSDGVYLRVADPADKPKISTTAEAFEDAIMVDKGSEDDDIYLYVQGTNGGKDWVYSKRLNWLETINISDIESTCGLSGLSSLKNCRVWLETTEDNVTYAKEVETSAPAEMKSFIEVKSLATEGTKYGLFTNPEQKIAVEFEEKADINPTVNITGWSYKGQANSPRVSDNLGNGTVTYEYKVSGADDKTYSSEVPTAVGNYTVKATIAETDEYKGGTATTDFAIKHAVCSTLNGLPRVLGGVGGEAGYRYNLTTGEPEFYCKPKPGYKLDSITETNGTKYVKFKIV